jgi:hypothetical protein
VWEDATMTKVHYPHLKERLEKGAKRLTWETNTLGNN